MGDAFNAESGQSHEVDLDVVIHNKNTNFRAELSMEAVNLALTVGEIKRDALNKSPDVPFELKNKPQDWDAFYVDDNKRKLINDNEKLAKYEGELCGANSKLELVYPSGRSYNSTPTPDFNGFNVDEKRRPQPGNRN